MAQLVEHILGKDEVPSSNLGSSSNAKDTLWVSFFGCVGSATLFELVFAREAQENQFAYPATERVELARKRQGAGIFANGEYLGINESYYLSLAPSNKIICAHAVKIA